MYNIVKKLLPVKIKEKIKRNPFLRYFSQFFSPLEVYQNRVNMMTDVERDYLSELASQVLPGNIIVEIGVYGGDSTVNLAYGARASNVHIYSIDPFDSCLERQIEEGDDSKYLAHLDTKPSQKEVSFYLKKQGVLDLVTLVKGFSEEVAENWNIQEPIGLLWVDGNHDRAYEDLQAWKPYLGKNSIIAFDDSAGVSPRGNVVKAIEKILEDKCFELVEVKGRVTTLRYSPFSQNI